MKILGRILLGLVLLLVVAACAFFVIYRTRIQTISSVQKMTA